jgi:hypothetical protein
MHDINTHSGSPSVSVQGELASSGKVADGGSATSGSVGDSYDVSMRGGTESATTAPDSPLSFTSSAAAAVIDPVLLPGKDDTASPKYLPHEPIDSRCYFEIQFGSKVGIYYHGGIVRY